MLKRQHFWLLLFFYCYYYLRSHYLLHKPTIDNLLGYCVVKNPSEIPFITCGSFNKIKKSNLKHLDFLFVLLEGHLLKSVNLQYNTLGRLDLGQMNRQPSVWCSKNYFFFMISCKNFFRNAFTLFSYFILKITKTKI